MDGTVALCDGKCRTDVHQSSLLADYIRIIFGRIETIPFILPNGKRSVSNEDLHLLNELFPHSVEPALHMIDHEMVAAHVAGNGRTLFQVKDAGGSVMSLLSTLTFCSCEEYGENVLEQKSTYMVRQTHADVPVFLHHGQLDPRMRKTRVRTSSNRRLILVSAYSGSGAGEAVGFATASYRFRSGNYKPYLRSLPVETFWKHIVQM